jgi:hypothetical protein
MRGLWYPEAKNGAILFLVRGTIFFAFPYFHDFGVV